MSDGLLVRIGRRVLVWCTDEGLVRCIVRAVSPRWSVVRVSSWTDLSRKLVDRTVVNVLVVDPYEESGALRPELADLRECYPGLPAVAVIKDVLTLGQWGITDVMDARMVEGGNELARRLEGVALKPLQRMLLSEDLQLSLDDREVAFVNAAVLTVTCGGRVEDMAAYLGLSYREMARSFAETSLPGPRDLLRWVRILWACSFLEETGRPLLDVARAVGYSSDTSLRRAFADHLKIPPSDLRGKGAWKTAVERFRSELTA